MAPGDNPRWRLFVAIPVPLEVKSTIQRTQAAIRQRLPKEGIGWTRPEQFHLTLKFLGDVPVESVPALIDALRAATAKFRPLTLNARGLGFFPNPRAPRVLWAGISDLSGQLEELQHRVEQACAGFSSEPAESRFHAHVTLARVKRFQGRVGDGLPDAVSACSDQEFGRWTASHIELIRSQLASTGPTYSVVAVGELRIEG